MTAWSARKTRVIATAAAAAFGVGAIGGLVTDLSPWYYALRKPSWQPPDWLFGPAWTTIFGLAAIAGYRAWIDAPGRRDRLRMLAFFALNAALNVGWSLLFFRLRRPDWAEIEVGLLWLSIVALIIVLARHSRLAGWLLAPYLAWVSFAAVLNHAIVRLNQPFP